MSRRQPAARLLSALALVGAQGCAALLRENMVPVAVSCNVPGAVVRVDGAAAGVGAVRVARGATHTITAEAPGYGSTSATIERRVSWGWFFVDLVLWWGLGNIVDFATGAAWDASPEAVTLSLAPLAPAPAPDAIRDHVQRGRFCQSCGAGLAAGARFCSSCGAAAGE